MGYTQLLHEEYDAEHPPGIHDYMQVHINDVSKATRDLGLTYEHTKPFRSGCQFLKISRPDGKPLGRMYMRDSLYESMRFPDDSRPDYYLAAFLLHIGRGAGEVLRRDVWHSAKAHATRQAIKARGDNHGRKLRPLIDVYIHDWIANG